jgi:hypothetical protein
MGSKHDYPEFSNIRSHVQRVEAQRDLEYGYALADALIDAGDFLRRGVAGMLSIFRLKGLRKAVGGEAPGDTL